MTLKNCGEKKFWLYNKLFFLKIVDFRRKEEIWVLTLQQIVLSKNWKGKKNIRKKVLTLQQIVLSKNFGLLSLRASFVLTLQQIVLSKNLCGFRYLPFLVLTLQQIVLSKNKWGWQNWIRISFDFTTNCSF